MSRPANREPLKRLILDLLDERAEPLFVPAIAEALARRNPLRVSVHETAVRLAIAEALARLAPPGVSVHETAVRLAIAEALARLAPPGVSVHETAVRLAIAELIDTAEVTEVAPARHARTGKARRMFATVISHSLSHSLSQSTNP